MTLKLTLMKRKCNKGEYVGRMLDSIEEHCGSGNLTSFYFMLWESF